MLPLWIIDLREKSDRKQSDRREHFEALLGQIDNVYIKRTSDPGEESRIEADTETTADVAGRDNDVPDRMHTPASADNYEKEGNSGATSREVPDISVEELIETDEERKAKKESVIEGDWWRYSPMADKDYKVDISQDTPRTEAAEITAKKLYEFQSDLVAEGQKFIRGLRESNAPPDVKFNVVVLGDLNEDFTRLIFPSVAGLLQKERGRILAHHIHQGMEIIGAIYIPSNLNALEKIKRESMKRTLQEIDVQHKVSDMRGYDHVMIYQDVQTRTDCHYSALSENHLQEYLFQCLIHLYYATNSTHPLLSGTPSAEDFYFSMGATSVVYDVENEDLKARHQFGIDFMRSLKKKGTDEKANLNLAIFKDIEYRPESFFDWNTINHLDREEVKLEEPRPHPVKDFLHKYLKRNYYNKYLRDFTRNMMHQIMSTIDDSTRGALEILASETKKKFNTAKLNIFNRLKEIFSELEANDGGLPTVIDLFKQMQDSFSKKKKEIAGAIRGAFWDKVEKDVPRDMQDAFMDYHDAYEQDIRAKNGGTRQTEMKKEVVTDLNDLLSQEATIMSRFNRAILLGIMLALALVPILVMISPHYINLGKVRRYSEWWSIGIFFVPVILQAISWFRFERRKRKAVNDLKALLLHDAYARVANRIESEIKRFYDKMIALGDVYIKRTEAIRNEVEKGYEDLILIRPLIPFTMFNQPLLGGCFGRNNLLPYPQAVDTEIRINYIPYKISEVSDREYYLFLHQHRNLMMELYKDVDLCESLIRRVSDTGEEELVTKEQQENEQELLWKEHLAYFQTHLSKIIKDSLVPRINDTVGEFLVANITGHVAPKDMLEPMVEFAANNGEATSSADLEMADIKVNDPRAVPYAFDYISTPFKYEQVAKHNHLYRKYIFLTRWRSFEEYSLNRILPMEDFDENVRRQRVYAEGKDWLKKKFGVVASQDEADAETVGNQEASDAVRTDNHGKVYFPYPSTLLLWALADDDSSTEWFRLLDSDFFAESYNDKEIYKEILNPDD